MIFRVFIFLFITLLLLKPSFSNEVENSLNELADKLVSQVEISEKSTLAVIPFETTSSEKKDQGRSIAEYLVAILQVNPSFELVDRIQFNKAMEEIALSQTGAIEEIALSQTGAIDENKAIEVGKALAANYILTGTISDALGKNMVHARIVETESTKIIASASISIETKDLTNFTKEMLGERGQVNAALFRSAVVPGWGQLYTNNKTRGIISLIACLGVGGTTIGLGIATSQANSDYKEYHNYMWTPEMIADRDEIVQQTGKTVAEVNAEFEQEEEDLYDDYNQKHDRTVIIGVITGCLWALNLVDATIAGVQSKKKFDLYFSGNAKNSELGIVYRF